MSLANIYESFLKNPTVEALADDATLNYITTLTTLQAAPAIVKHLASQQKLLRKKEEKLLSRIESPHAVCLDVETTIEFLSGGGAYLPGLDDNFLTDRTVTFPIIHIVHFDSSRKIQQIRLHWDQGSLLKLVDVIGSRAKNWPIRDGRDQIRLIKSSTDAVPSATESTTKEIGGVIITTNQTSPRKNTGNGDPHASLSLFAPRVVSEHESLSTRPVAPRASAKPPPRDYHDLFVGSDSEASPAARVPSPQKNPEPVLAPKGGAGKNYQPSRLFDTGDEEESVPDSPRKGSQPYLKPNPTKYNHFHFSDGSEEPENKTPVKPREKSKHDSQWSFDDFTTPAKPVAQPKSQEVRHFGWSDDEATESPTKNPHVDKPRRDAETHFEFQDDGTPAAGKRPANPRGHATSNSASGLYQNNLYDDESGGGVPARLASQTTTATNLKDRKKDFAPHFDMTDSPQGAGENGLEKPHANVKDRRKDFDAHWDMTDSPGLGEKSASETNRPLPDHRNKAVKMMTAQWQTTDASPGTKKNATATAAAPPSSGAGADVDKENIAFGQEKRTSKVHAGGDGMGGRNGAERNWGFGDDSDEHSKVETFRAGKKQQAPKSEGLWDF